MLRRFGCDGKFSSYEELGSYLESGKTVTLCDDTPMGMIAYIKNERPAGLSVEKTCERTFYDEGCAPHILGHTGENSGIFRRILQRARLSDGCNCRCGRR